MTTHFQSPRMQESLGFHGVSESRGGDDVRSVLSGGLNAADEDVSGRKDRRVQVVRSPLSM